MSNGNKLVVLATALTIIVVLLTFFFLNYFNVLSLSGIFPKQLGWLPHLEVTSLNGGQIYNAINLRGEGIL